jgi:hypothetical protein
MSRGIDILRDLEEKRQEARENGRERERTVVFERRCRTMGANFF